MIPKRAIGSILFALGIVATSGCSDPSDTAATLRPNIVLLIGDDHGYSDFGFMGSEWVETPNLDRLAEEGVVFELAHTTSNHCRPSLNTLLTGLLPFQWRYRLSQLEESNSELDEARAIEQFRTLPRLLAERGYVSFQAGKYWEGDFRAGGFTDGMTRVFDPEIPHGGAGIALGRQTMDPVYRFIENNADRPFFLWFAPMLPHVPHDAPQEYRDRYQTGGLSDSARAYFANCTWYDDLVGQLMGFLAEQDLTRNTLVIYVSDNGWEQSPFAERADPMEAFMGGPKGKLSLHDPGFRTPIIFSWPGVIAPRRISNQLVSTADLVPSILDYAGAPIPAELQGISLQPSIEGATAPERPFIIGSVDSLRRTEPMRFKSFDEFTTRLNEMHPAARAFHLRSLDWHYLWYESGDREELYDLGRDPEEAHDVASENPDRVARYRAEIERWQRHVTQPFSATSH